MREVAVNTAYRWFAGFRLTDKVPDASTFSQHRRRRYTDPAVYQSIFDAIVRQAMGHGLVGGRVLYTDSTHLKANANKKQFDTVQLEQTPSAYLAELDAAVDADRKAHGKKPLRRDDAPPAPKETKVNRTDPDSGYLMREGKPEGFFYLDHRTVDARHAIITDTHVTAGNVHDSQPYLARLDRTGRPLGLGPVTEHEVEDKKNLGMSAEGVLLSRVIPEGAALCILDERGKTLSSPEFAQALAVWRDAGRQDAAFVIGGADGIDPSLRAKADLSISLGRMVWPHMLVRVMLAEQLYRAATILAGSPYHRA